LRGYKRKRPEKTWSAKIIRKWIEERIPGWV